MLSRDYSSHQSHPTQEFTEKVILITGATSGIGLATAKDLAGRGASIILAGRSEVKARQAVTEIRQIYPNIKVDYVLADLSSQKEIRRMVDAIYERFDRLDRLINNAGAHFLKRQVNTDNIELTFAVNHLAPFLITQLLLPLLQNTARDHGEVRIINVSSDAHYGAELDFTDLMFERRSYFFGWPAYKQSKLANVLFSSELDRRVKSQFIRSFSLHPGLVPTNIFNFDNGILTKLVLPMVKKFGVSVEEGAQTSIYLASSEEGNAGGGYFIQNKPATPDPHAENIELGLKLWEISEEYTKY